MNAPTKVRSGFPWVYMLLASGVSWLIWLPTVLATAGIIPAPLPIELFTGLLIMLDAFGPLVAAFTCTAREEGRVGVRHLLARGRHWRIG